MRCLLVACPSLPPMPVRSHGRPTEAADSGHLGSGLPYAVDAKLARSNVPVYCITGDGSFGFKEMELETAMREDAPVAVIIAHNRAWGMIRAGQKLVYGERDVGVDLSDVRYDKLAESMCCSEPWIPTCQWRLT